MLFLKYKNIYKPKSKKKTLNYIFKLQVNLSTKINICFNFLQKKRCNNYIKAIDGSKNFFNKKFHSQLYKSFKYELAYVSNI